jgi:hypothetical protein
MAMGFNAYRHLFSHANAGNSASSQGRKAAGRARRQSHREKAVTIEGFSYEEDLRLSQPARWRLDEIIGGNNRLNSEPAFLPGALARGESLGPATSLPYRSDRPRLLLGLAGILSSLPAPHSHRWRGK